LRENGKLTFQCSGYGYLPHPQWHYCFGNRVVTIIWHKHYWITFTWRWDWSEIITVAVEVLKVVGEQLIWLEFQSALIGVLQLMPLVNPTRCHPGYVPQQRCVLLSAIGGISGPLPRHLRPESGLLGLKSWESYLPTCDQRKFYRS